MTSLHDAAVDRLRQVTQEPELLDDRFEILGVIGQGGMGTIYRTRDRILDREVALKVVRPELLDPSAASRLARESRILARLEHPGVVAVHDVGQLADGRTYYLMRLVTGARLDQLPPETSRADRLRLFLRVAETIEFAHSRGVIHRDLKPANVMLGAFGEVVVLDWGIAKVTGASDDVSEVTSAIAAPGDTLPGTVLGTPGFMAPEQATGELSRIDQRTDVYGLGGILHWLVSSEGVPTPRPLQAICGRAQAPDPGSRYPTAHELAADVTRFLDGAPVHAHRESLVERMVRLYRKYQVPILLVAAYLLMRLLFLAFRRTA
jgi:serine/threonine-protein kinase